MTPCPADCLCLDCVLAQFEVPEESSERLIEVLLDESEDP